MERNKLRSLDVEIARWVLGCHTVWEDDSGEPICCCDLEQHSGGNGSLILPRYSRAMIAAWQVVAAMHERGWWCRLETPWKLDEQQWMAGFTPHGTTGWNGRTDHRAVCATMPEAIARAGAGRRQGWAAQSERVAG